MALLLALGVAGCSGGAEAPAAFSANPGTPAPSVASGSQPSPSPSASPSPPASGSAAVPIVFVSRQILPSGSIYYAPAKGMPGVGPFSRAAVAAPGRLQIREPDGTVRTLIDGAQPTAATLNLIDVNAPDVSWDGRTIVFAGLSAHARNNRFGPEGYAGAWRIYTIQVDGSGLRQVTGGNGIAESELRARNLPESLSMYDDFDPVWLPDGRIVFSSTRYPSYGQYSGVRTSNLFIVNADGSNLRRLTSERNGADRPMIDPLTGRIVFARWWRNMRMPVDSLATVTDASGIVQKDGLTVDRDSQSPSAEAMFRNAWHAAVINPDGTGLAMFSGAGRSDLGNHMYGGTFDAAGNLIANFFPMYNMTEAGGFGGLRVLPRGAARYRALAGITDFSRPLVAPNAFGIHQGEYVSEPAVLPDGRLVVSIATSIAQDYGLWIMSADGSRRELLLDYPGTAELRAKPVMARVRPPVLPAGTAPAPAPFPPTGTNYAQDGTFLFDARNIYFNAPVDTDIISAPAVGSAATIRFFIDHQRSSRGSLPGQDWPILLGELPVSPAGAVQHVAPANVPLFEQLRDRQGRVPVLPSALDSVADGNHPNNATGSAHVAGFNFGAPGSVATCVGCHTGHTMIPVPASAEDIEFTNLAPGARVVVSSSADPARNGGLIDRRVMKGEIWRYWRSAPGQQQNQWVRLEFPVPITVKAVRLYNPRPGDEANSSVQVRAATVDLCSDTACTQIAASAGVGIVAVGGTTVAFDRVRARAVRVRLDDVVGTFYGARVASLAEIEVIARGEAP
ncbi:MAG: hypothetical protein RMK97_00430 [Sutterellaceae bacterium]|nr:hypothetical protein [Burkholderiaceae bacterium]MDW8428968.1 hypothetical protein [Sutterellaceae bacterium]